jgi:MoaA/NifB/PqqE/SkfB family radical SAM enzyme
MAHTLWSATVHGASSEEPPENKWIQPELRGKRVTAWTRKYLDWSLLITRQRPEEGTPLLDSSNPRRGLPARLRALLAGAPELSERLSRLRHFARLVRASEYHLTNACNLRCEGCWFFEYDFDSSSREESNLDTWREFIEYQRARGVTAPLLIGGEPALYPERIALFVEAMPYVTVSSNGLQPLPIVGFERVAIALTLFGGGPWDDRLRGIEPSGRRRTGLFDRVLHNYAGDARATFVFALTTESRPFIEDVVVRVRENGNQITFNHYSAHGNGGGRLSPAAAEDLAQEAIRVRNAYPDTVIAHPYFIRTLLTGRSHWGRFGYEVCPSLSVDHPEHKERLRNGNPVLRLFNSYAADTRSLNFCCTSGRCEDCCDSQAVQSWLLVGLPHFAGTVETISTWLELAESYWRQFVWSPYHRVSSSDSYDRVGLR